MIHVRGKLGVRSSTFKTSLARRAARGASSGGAGVLPSSRVGRRRLVLRPQVSSEMRARDADARGPEPHRRGSGGEPGGSGGLRGAPPGVAFPGQQSRTPDQEAERTHGALSRGAEVRVRRGGGDRGSVAVARPDAPRAEPRQRATRVGVRAAFALRPQPPAPRARPLRGPSPAPARAPAPAPVAKSSRAGREVAREALPGATAQAEAGSGGGGHPAAWLGPRRLRSLPGRARRAPPGRLHLGRVGGGRPGARTPLCSPGLCSAPRSSLRLRLLSLSRSLFLWRL